MRFDSTLSCEVQASETAGAGARKTRHTVDRLVEAEVGLWVQRDSTVGTESTADNTQFVGHIDWEVERIHMQADL